MIPPGHVGKIFRWCCTSGLEGITSRSPSPRIGQILSQRAFYQPDDVFTNIREKFKSVANRY